MFFGGYIGLNVPSLRKSFDGRGGGLLIGFGGSAGTLYYNDLNDLKGETGWNANFLSVYSNINFLTPSSSIYATYSGGGSPLLGTCGAYASPKNKWMNV